MPGMTDVRRMTSWIWGLVSACLLFVVVAHAVAPVVQEHGRGRGSAFSASTGEVSLKSGARAAVAKDMIRVEPPAPMADLFVPVMEMPAQPRSGIDSEADPASSVSQALSPISPRAPPLA